MRVYKAISTAHLSVPVQAASENLQQQTAEGQEANLDFRDAQDIRALLQAAQQEDILTGFQLNAVAATLQVVVQRASKCQTSS